MNVENIPSALQMRKSASMALQNIVIAVLGVIIFKFPSSIQEKCQNGSLVVKIPQKIRHDWHLERLFRKSAGCPSNLSARSFRRLDNDIEAERTNIL